MQTQLRLRWLARRACAPGVLSSLQIGVTVHALQQLDMLTVTAPTSSTSILPIIETLCGAADGRSQANMLHALACATREQCTPRVSVSAPLCTALERLQAELVSSADTLTAPETILVMEALVNLVPFASEKGTLILQRLLDEVQERTMALASVVERAVDLIGVTRVVVEAATAAAFTAPSAALSTQSLTTSSTAAWAGETLEHVLLVVQARLGSFSGGELMALMDALTVRRAHARVHEGEEEEKDGAAAVHTDDADQRVVFLDAARFLLDELLDRVQGTLGSLSAAQLAAWLTRLVNLRLTDHPLLRAVLEALTVAGRRDGALTVAQLAAVARAHASLLSLVVSAPGLWSTTELCVKTYVHFVHQLVTQLNQRPRDDPSVVEDARAHLLPLLLRFPETELTAYLQLAAREDGRFAMPAGAVTVANTSNQVRAFYLLAAALETASALLLRHFGTLEPREQAQVVGFAFHWRLYLPRPARSASTAREWQAAGEGPDSPLDAEVTPTAAAAASVPSAVELMEQCSVVSAADAARKHRAVCGLVESNLDAYGAKDCVQMLNEMVTAHHAQASAELTSPSINRSTPVHSQAASSSEEKTGHDSGSKTAGTAGAMDSACATAAKERVDLALRLSARLQGPLLQHLSEVHTAQLVRYLASMSKLNIRTREPYNAVLLLLKGRSLTSFEQISVLGVLARHHLRSPYVVYGITRDLPQLGQSLRASQKAALIKFLGQAGAQRFVKAPRAEGLEMGTFFRDAAELQGYTMRELVFCFNGLVALRQNTSPSTAAVLAEMETRRTSRHAVVGADGQRALNAFRFILSPTLLAELVVALCRHGGPAQGVSPALVAEALRALQLRLGTSRSLFVDATQLTGNWPCVVQYMDRGSVLWDSTTLGSAESSAEAEWAELADAFERVRATARRKLQERLLSIAASPTLRRNTFLWNQIACGARFDALPPRGSADMERLWEHLERTNLAALLYNPQQLLDVMTVALLLLPERELESVPMLQFVKKHMASLRMQDALQVWWYASREVAAAKPGVTCTEKTWQLLQSVRHAAKEHVLNIEKGAAEKLTVMEHQLLRSLT